MRVLFLSALMIAIAFGIPWFTSVFREWTPVEKSQPAVTGVTTQTQMPPLAAIVPVRNIAEVKAAAADEPAPEQAVPIVPQPQPPRPAQVQVQGGDEEPALPKNERELIAAIQKELRRLGYYRGPSHGRWSKRVRAAAREFWRANRISRRNPRPTLELLTSLRAVDPQKRGTAERKEASRQAPALVKAESAIPEPPLAVNGAQAPASARALEADEDYLPPWMRGARTRYADNGEPQVASRAQEKLTASRAAAGPSGQGRRKRHVSGHAARVRHASRRAGGWPGSALFPFF